jgi:hypothetical protein
MTCRLLRHAAIAALVVSAAAPPLLAQDTPIRSVRVTVAPKTRGATAIIQNRRDSALLAWRIETAGSISDANDIGDLLRIPGLG